MSEFIDKQMVIDALEWKWAGKAALDAIKKLPSTEIIYCKDCKYYKAPERTWYGDTKICTYSAFRNTKPDDFCSKAERKKNYCE